jgi:TonB-dependent starch-binding outer membrane protein SusC
MKKKRWNFHCRRIPCTKQLCRIMKLTTFLLFVLFFQVSAGVFSQNNGRLSLKAENESVNNILKMIEERTEFRFMYNTSNINVERKVNINCDSKSITEVLDLLFEGTNVKYRTFNSNYVLYADTGNAPESVQQQKSVTGKVIDSSGGPLPGVSVVIKGTTTGVITDMNGKYILSKVPDNATLVFSFVGMKTQEIKIEGKTTISVTLEEETVGIEEVVAIGYGTMQKSNVTSSISEVNVDQLNRQITSSLDQSLQGLIPGAQVEQTTGNPGGSSSIRIRGSSSVGAGSDPLFVIDGNPMPESYDKNQNPLSWLNPSDIESVTVLKDASSTAIYGSRGSNGVILITTKSGKEGKTTISFNASLGIQNIMKNSKLDVMNAHEFATWRYENAEDYAKYYGTTFSVSDDYKNPDEYGKGTDWQEELLQTGVVQDYGISVSHGTKNFKSYFSVGYMNQEGIIIETNFSRLSVLASFDYTSNNKFLQMGLNLNPSVQKWGPNAGGGRGSVWGTAATLSPLVPVRDANGEYTTNITSDGMFDNGNPIVALKETTDKTTKTNLQIQPYITLNFLKGLSFKSSLNLLFSDNTNEYFNPSTVTGMMAAPPDDPYGTYTTTKNKNWIFENTFTYDTKIGDHKFNAVTGLTMEHYNWVKSYLYGTGYADDAIRTINAATSYTGYTNEENWSMVSYLFRLNYSYLDKYLLTGTLRSDGCSRFGSDNRWGVFPSGSIGWSISKEKFFPKLNWLENLKLRASYGINGNNNIGNYTYQATINSNNYDFGGTIVNGRTLSSLSNSQLGWEKTKEFDAGINLDLFKNRLSIVADFYNRLTTDMLWSVNIPISSGFSSMQNNIGELRNRGFEFSFSSINISGKKFTWKTDFNISFNRNKVLDLGDVKTIYSNWFYDNYCNVTKVGLPMAQFYGYKFVKIFQTQEEIDASPHYSGQLPGSAQYADADNSGTVDALDYVPIGDPNPKFTGGMINRFAYKNWDLNLTLSFAYDFDVLAIDPESTTRNLDGVFNVFKNVKDRWRSVDNPGNGKYATSLYDTEKDRANNSRMVYDGSFIKIQNLNVGYNFHKIKWFDSFRVYCSVQNLCTFTKFPYGNPEVNYYGNSSLSRGVMCYDYPLARTISLGTNITF